ncbi:TIM barrel protein [Rhodococcoides fascians A25f]|uniref:hydroxypyruvate isomerase family protein n=1 Tax=Rhodococcoides fascians TaxID=1828 RepID=UPI000562BBA6|nr:TIM barrel protein [Rhodococcus fascians]QII07286.1 TIM barrel protein [Rhodococcus fascians A25f]
MTPLPVRTTANLTLLFPEVDFLHRPRAAKEAGFDRVECWWPFGAKPRPTASEVNEFVSAIDDAGVKLVHMNLFGGDMAAGERGVLSHPERRDDFADSLEPVRTIARDLGTKLFNVPYGHSRSDLNSDDAFTVAEQNLRAAHEALKEFDAVVLLEAVSGMPQYPIKTSDDAIALLDRLRARDAGPTGYLFDQFHLVRNGEDVFDSVRRVAPYIAHVQVADTPDRHEPGSGDFDFTGWLKLLNDVGYVGDIALEFNPAGNTLDALSAIRRSGVFH